MTTKTTIIEGETLVGGTSEHQGLTAFHVIIRKGSDQLDKTESWRGPLPDAPDTIARGVGKVREEGGQSEELLEYSVAGQP